MTPQEWNDFIEKEAQKWCLENQFASHKDRGVAFKEAVQFVLDNLDKVPVVSEVVKASDSLITFAKPITLIKNLSDETLDLDCAIDNLSEALSKLRGRV